MVEETLIKPTEPVIILLAAFGIALVRQAVAQVTQMFERLVITIPSGHIGTGADSAPIHLLNVGCDPSVISEGIFTEFFHTDVFLHIFLIQQKDPPFQEQYNTAWRKSKSPLYKPHVIRYNRAILSGEGDDSEAQL